MLARRRIVQVFLVRDETILILQRASGRAKGWWSPPGGNVDEGEEPSAAAIRETFEETGLRIADLRFVRDWVFRHAADDYDRHITSFAAAAPDGSVTLSEEHTDHAWIALDEYEQRYCGEHLEPRVPAYAAMFREVRADCAIVRAMMLAKKF
jgi:8-oxo-dGTP pyrophosphatase MutT (NUDIX family)